ncbi:MAG TPA: DCC1-like thiol-disulfide oxidoreductase family protein [Actinomycetota bacterium]|nr:DCC1-like thiol-disulfide oxidoreductase family protein [Actinomycetota bacterium]
MNEAILFYDGACPVCRLTARLAVAADTERRLRTATLDSPDADRHLGKLSKEDRFGSFHLVVEGRLISGGEAVGPTLEQLRRMRPVGRFIGRSPAARRAAAWAYGVVSRNRGRIGKVLPDVAPPSR